MAIGIAAHFLFITASSNAAETSANDLASKANNPASPTVQLQIQNQFTPETYNADGYANSFVVQPVIPFALGPDNYFQSIITRTTIPLITAVEDENGDHDIGLGDTTILVLPAHNEPSQTNKGEFFTWGPMGAIVLPTATDDRVGYGKTDLFGSGKLSIGAGGLVIWKLNDVITNGDGLQVGAMGYHIQSVAGDSSRDDVSKTFGQPILVYTFNELFGEKGWYAGTPDDLFAYDHEKDRFSSIPIGARLGKVFSIGEQPVSMFAQAWYSPADEGAYPKYGLKLNLTFLFTK